MAVGGQKPPVFACVFSDIFLFCFSVRGDIFYYIPAIFLDRPTRRSSFGSCTPRRCCYASRSRTKCVIEVSV
jgi:hypothetical protein